MSGTSKCRCSDPIASRYGPEQVCWRCFATSMGDTEGQILEPMPEEAYALFGVGRPGDPTDYGRPFRGPDVDQNGAGPEQSELAIVPLEEFIEVDEPGAAALVGDPDNVLIPEGGDVMFYGDGGAGKTTLSIDLACHLAAGQDWLEIPVSRPVRVLIIENEGPRPLLRKKLRRKAQAWKGASLEGRISVFERPWGQFTFATDQWRAELAQIVKAHEIDVLIAGPLTRIGMDSAGTLQEVAAFLRLIQDVRAQSRPLTVGLIHHEGKNGTVSGAWEGSGDTLLHVEARGNGYTSVHVQKARWSSAHHNTTIELAWTDGEGFRLKEPRSLLDEIAALLSDGKWRIAKEIAAPEEKGGIGANIDSVKTLLDEHPELFESRTGDDAQALGRSPKAIVWKRTQAPESVESVTDFLGSEPGTDSRTPPLRESVVPSHSRPKTQGRTQTPKSVDADGRQMAADECIAIAEEETQR